MAGAPGLPLLTPTQLTQAKLAISRVFATFAKEPVVFKQIRVKIAPFGEKADNTDFTPYNLEAIYAYTTAHDGKYDIIQRTDKGSEIHDGFRLYIWKDDMIAAGLLAIDAEQDHVIFKGKEYDLDFAAPSAQFSTLSELLWEIEVRFRHRT